MVQETIEPLSRVALQLGPIKIYWYGLLIGMGVLIGYLIASKESERLGWPKGAYADLLIWIIPSGIIGARIYYVIFRWEDFADNPLKAFAIWEGGLAIHGVLIGGVTALIIFAIKRGFSFWKLLDITAPSILLAQAIGRWGNFMNQEVYGRPIAEEHIETFYRILPDFIMHQMYIDDRVLGLGYNYYHPTFLYESIWNLIGVAVLLYLRRVNLREGELFFSYLIWYSFGRYFIEGLRLDNLTMGDLRAAQIMSIILIVGSVFLWWFRRYKGLANKRYLDPENVATEVTPKAKKKKNNKKKK